MEDIHDRMPVILEESEEMEWLSANTGQKELSRLLKPYSGGLEVMQVSTAVNSAKHNTSHLVQALPDNEEAAEREPQ